MKRVRIWSNFSLVSAAFVAFYACRSAVNVTTEDVPEGVRDFQASVVSDFELSQITRQYMRTQASIRAQPKTLPHF